MTAAEIVAAVKAETDVDIDIADVLKRIVANLGRAGMGTRAGLLQDLSGHGSGVSAAIVRACGFDPDETVGVCPECGGTGSVDCDHPDHDDDCEECQGFGYVDCPECGATGESR